MMIALLGTTTTATAQGPWGGPWGGADTATSANLRGAGQLLHGQADRLRALGDYRIRQQQAYSRYLENNNARIRLRWAIKDDYKARNARPSYLDRMEARMDVAERRFALKQRENDLIEKGILPPKPKPGFTRNGIRYESYAEYKLSPAFAEMIAERDIRLAKEAAEEAAKEARRRDAVIFGAMWAKMSPVAKDRYSRLSPELKARQLAEFKNPDLMWKRLEDNRNRRFYEARPYLVPQAGKNGMPPLPSDWKK
jgi:hypothetical protein|tara:strand:+ start:4731 stop:5489 length:759 start_codon:yes stop_codon:yes gene_type:complete